MPIYRNYCILLNRSCEVAIAQGEAENALQKVADLQNMEEVQNEPHLQVQVLLLHASALCIASTYSVAVQPLVLAVTEAKKHHLALLHSLSIMMLLALRLQLGLLKTDQIESICYKKGKNTSIHPYNYYSLTPSISHSTIDEAYSIIVSNGCLYDKARTLFLVAKLRVLSAKGKPDKLAQIAKDLDVVKDMFTKVDALNRLRDTLYLSVSITKIISLSVFIIFDMSFNLHLGTFLALINEL